MSSCKALEAASSLKSQAGNVVSAPFRGLLGVSWLRGGWAGSAAISGVDREARGGEDAPDPCHVLVVLTIQLNFTEVTVVPISTWRYCFQLKLFWRSDFRQKHRVSFLMVPLAPLLLGVGSASREAGSRVLSRCTC